MEDDIQSLLDYGHVIARLADSLATDDANMVARLGWQVVHHARAAETLRAKLFHALHHLKYPLAERGPDKAA
jgi:hypothetical protein